MARPTPLARHHSRLGHRLMARLPRRLPTLFQQNRIPITVTPDVHFTKRNDSTEPLLTAETRRRGVKAHSPNQRTRSFRYARLRLRTGTVDPRSSEMAWVGSLQKRQITARLSPSPPLLLFLLR